VSEVNTVTRDKHKVEASDQADNGSLSTLEKRRSFLAKFASAVFAGLVTPAVAGQVQPVQAQTPDYGLDAQVPSGPLQAGIAYEDVLVRMQRELESALARPHVPRWVMVIDTRKCSGCHACTIACIAEHALPPGVVYRPVIEEEIGEYPNVRWRFTPRPCMQCDKPPCVPVCPVGATWKAADGIVDIDYERCIGCRYCLTACPYQARTSDFGEFWTDGTPGGGKMPYETLPVNEYGKARKREHGTFGFEKSPIGNARKCHFCRQRISRGLLPQCVTSCVGRATFFGDASDPTSLVSELMAQPNAVRLKEELGLKPRVYYLV
jgi:Fe-S-cluster-containing dehydrogenase component